MTPLYVHGIEVTSNAVLIEEERKVSMDSQRKLIYFLGKSVRYFSDFKMHRTF